MRNIIVNTSQSVTVGAVLAMLALPGQAWEAASQPRKAQLAGEFVGRTPAEWVVQTNDVDMGNIAVTAFTNVSNHYQAAYPVSADKNVFQVRVKKAVRHSAIHSWQVGYLSDGTPITPEWDATTQLTTLVIPGTLTPAGGGGSQPLTITAKFRGGVVYEARINPGANLGPSKNFVFCRKSSVKTTTAYVNYPFAGLIAPLNHSAALDATMFNAYTAITKANIDAMFLGSEAQGNNTSMAVCDNSYPALTPYMDMVKAQFGSGVADNQIILPNGSVNYPIRNDVTSAGLAAVLTLAGSQDMTLTSSMLPRPGTWLAPLTVQLTAI